MAFLRTKLISTMSIFKRLNKNWVRFKLVCIKIKETLILCGDTLRQKRFCIEYWSYGTFNFWITISWFLIQKIMERMWIHESRIRKVHWLGVQKILYKKCVYIANWIWSLSDWIFIVLFVYLFSVRNGFWNIFAP